MSLTVDPQRGFFAPYSDQCGADCYSFIERWLDWWTHRQREPLAMLDCRAGYFDRLPSKSRNMVRKARRLYEFRRFFYNEHLTEIDGVNSSKAFRQGKPMQGWYVRMAVATRAEALCANHRDEWWGAFWLDGVRRGRLAAYCHLEVLGGLAIINSILGHADAPAAVNGLIAAMAESDVDWINYLRLSNDSLGDFKRRVGFEEAMYP